MSLQRALLNNQIQKNLPKGQTMRDALIAEIIKLPEHYEGSTQKAIQKLESELNPQKIRLQTATAYSYAYQAMKKLPKKQTIVDSVLQIKNLFEEKKLSGLLAYNTYLQDKLIDSLILMYDIPGFKYNQKGQNSFSRIKNLIKRVLNINQGSKYRQQINQRIKIQSQIKSIIDNPAFVNTNFIIQKYQQRDQQLKRLQVLQQTTENVLKMAQSKILDLIKFYNDESIKKQSDFYLIFWKVISSFMEDKMTIPQLERITKSLNKNPLYVQVLNKNLRMTTLETLEMIKQYEKQNIFQNYEINSKAIQKSLQLSWSYFKNSMLKTIQSTQQMDKAQYEFLKQSLNSSQNSMPCCLTARVIQDKPLQIQVYAIKSNAISVQQRKKQYAKIGLTYKGINNSDKKVETVLDYVVQNLEPFSQNGIKVGEQSVITVECIAKIVKKIIGICQILKIKAIIIGDKSELISKKFLNPEEKYYRHYLKQKGEKPYNGFRGTVFHKPIKQCDGFPPYFCPINWVRFPLFITQNSEQFDKRYKNWLIAYHGTDKNAVLSILSHGFRCATGAFSKNDPVSYYSPSIQYAAMYSQPFYCQKLNKFIQVVISVKIKKEVIIKRGKHTLPIAFKDGDPNFNQNWPEQFQWLVKGKSNIRKSQINKEKYRKAYEDNIRMQDGVVPYGIMVKLSDKKPTYRKDQKKPITIFNKSQAQQKKIV